MDFLKQFRKIEATPLYDSNGIKVVDINGTKAMSTNDKVVILPYLVNRRGILLKYEEIPAFEVRQKNIKDYLTCVVSDIDGEVIDTVKNSIMANFAIELFDDEDIHINIPIFLSKNECTKYYFVYVLLYEGKYQEVNSTEFQKLEMKETNAMISLDDLDNCVVYDLTTRYAIDELKRDYLLF